MKNCLKNLASAGFLALFLPYTILLLVNGWDGIHREQDWPVLEYRTLELLMEEDLSETDEGLLPLLAVICRTRCMAQGEDGGSLYKYVSAERTYGEAVRAIEETLGMAVMVDGAYRELPYHAVSAGCTRQGSLLGEGYHYVKAVECPRDMEADGFLQICTLTWEELRGALDMTGDEPPEELTVIRDAQDYVIRVEWGDAVWTGEAFRTLLHLPSSCFQMDEQEDCLRIATKGRGHGFGISLYTASRMLREGASIEEVIQCFYEGAECITVP